MLYGKIQLTFERKKNGTDISQIDLRNALCKLHILNAN